MLEKAPNEQVRQTMQEVDILTEQVIATGHSVNGTEGMALDQPVITNLEHEAHTRVLRRKGFLEECPSLSTGPKELLANLRLLFSQPELLYTLGVSGSSLVDEYHF